MIGRSVSVVHVVTVPVTLEFLAGQAEFMSASGFSLAFVSASGEGQKDFALRERAAVHTVAMSRRITPAADLRALWALFRLLRRMSPTIVHAHTPKAGLLAMLGARAAGVPVRIYHLHGLPYETARGLKRLIQTTGERVACAAATRVLSVSRSVAARAAGDRLCHPSRLQVPGPGSIAGIDAQVSFNPAHADGQPLRRLLGIPSDAVVVGFVGRLARDKGIETLWDAWTQLRDAHPGARLLIVGPDETSRGDQRLPAALTDALASDPRVHRTGAVQRDVLPQYYAAMDMLCLPTFREGFPVTVLEAAAMGLPCVASRVTGCVDAVVDGATGVLVRAGDAGVLRFALDRYIREPHLRRRHGVAARARAVQHFRPRAVWEALRNQYLELLAEAG